MANVQGVNGGYWRRPVGIESILYEYIHGKLSPQVIEPKFRTVTLEQVYATIPYYFHNRESVDKYVSQKQRNQVTPFLALTRTRATKDR